MTVDSAGTGSSTGGGWFPDPWQPDGQIRWWSGTEWTTHVRAMPQIAAEVGFGEAVKRGFRGWRRWSGRASATEYWWWFLFVNIITAAFYFVGYFIFIVSLIAVASSTSSAGSGSGVASTTQTDVNGGAVAAIVVLALLALVAYVVLILLPWLAVSVRRLHDTGRSGALLWLLLVPFGSLLVLVFQAFPSTPAANQYGPVPS
ncbi:MAG: DUF805 domain-containing protein [Actinomycetes bacterium]